jgi:hypothetical protein
MNIRFHFRVALRLVSHDPGCALRGSNGCLTSAQRVEPSHTESGKVEVFRTTNEHSRCRGARGRYVRTQRACLGRCTERLHEIAAKQRPREDIVWGGWLDLARDGWDGWDDMVACWELVRLILEFMYCLSDRVEAFSCRMACLGISEQNRKSLMVRLGCINQPDAPFLATLFPSACNPGNIPEKISCC